MLKPETPPVILILVLVAAAAQAAPCTSPRTVETLAEGLEHHVLCRGEVATSTTYRVVVGVFDRQSDADEMLRRMEDNGFEALPETEGGEYRIVTPPCPSPAEAEDLRNRLIARGFATPLKIEEIGQGLTSSDGPWRIHVLVAEPDRVEVRVAHACDAAIGLETTRDLAERHGAVAAVNGGYFRMRGLLAGDSQGVLRIDGRLLSEPDRGRAAVGFADPHGRVRSVFGRLGFRGELRLASGGSIPLDGLNRQRKPAEIVLYTPEFHRTTLTPPGGAEVVISDREIIDIRQASGSSVIPSGGLVLSIGGERVKEVLPMMRLRERVTVETEILPLLPDPGDEWQRAEDIVGGGPLLLFDGRRLEEPEKESISRVFFHARHPRTAVGVRADGALLLVTVDGRRPGESVGMSIPELTDLMLELGCRHAINLDGGGSTTMVIDSQTVNHPSGSGDDRRNADGILLFERWARIQGSPVEGKVICLDPGHGGTADSDSFRVGPGGEREEWINLRVALLLREMLEERGARVLMTRTTDVAVDLGDRARLAVANGADVFVSIHHNATADPTVNFPIVYFHGKASENAAGVALGRILARGLRNALFDGDTPACLISDHAIFPGSGANVLRNSYGIPGVIGEASFFSNPEEEQRLRQQDENRFEAGAYLACLEEFFSADIPPIADKNSRGEIHPFPVLQEGDRMDEDARSWRLLFERGLELMEKRDRGSLEAALDLFTRSARTFPDSYLARECHRHRAEILAALGDETGAAVELQRADEHYPELD